MNDPKMQVLLLTPFLYTIMLFTVIQAILT